MHPIAAECRSRGWTYRELSERSTVGLRTIEGIVSREHQPRKGTRRLLFAAFRWRWCPDEARKVFGPLPTRAR